MHMYFEVWMQDGLADRKRLVCQYSFCVFSSGLEMFSSCGWASVLLACIMPRITVYGIGMPAGVRQT